jgi:hypothetical protein
MLQLEPLYAMKLKVIVTCEENDQEGEREVEVEHVHAKGLMLMAKGGIESLIADCIKLTKVI